MTTVQEVRGLTRDGMSRLIAELRRCVGIANGKGEKIRIHIHPSTLYELMGYTDIFMLENGLKGYNYSMWGVPVIIDKDIVEDNFWIERVTK